MMKKPYRIIGAYDSETSNVAIGGIKRAFPILHQLGIIRSSVCSLKDITPENVEDTVKVSLFRHTHELTYILDCIANKPRDYVPVIMCHNLAFDIYPLASWLNSRNVRVLAKSRRKPITFTILDDENEPCLVIWDTLVFSQKPLSMMGHECGYDKADGEWDYMLVRTPETELTDAEKDYAKRDIYALVAWVGYWLRLNPDIPEEMLGLNVVTKTGVIRAKRRIRFDGIKGKGHKYNVGRYWHFLNKQQLPKDDDELFTMHACTRGGFTFCSSKWASVPIAGQGNDAVLAFDSTSQHPAQMVSHRVPIGFRKASIEALANAFSIVRKKSVDKVLAKYDKPFFAAFNACFEFTNLRPKAGSVFEREGIYPLATARATRTEEDTENESALNFERELSSNGYKDEIEGGTFAFGKVASAKRARLWITELAAWEICRCYDFDSVRPIQGYIATRWVKPSDMAVISVMQFYKAKNEFKKARESYYKHSTIENGNELVKLGFSEETVRDMKQGTISTDDVDFLYLGTKADINGLFGIEASNEFRQQTILSDDGIAYEGAFSIENAPKNPKAHYQYGQRIVGWSRVAQVIVMELCAPFVKGIVNGDTDSVKFYMDKAQVPNLAHALEAYSSAIDAAKAKVCARVRTTYPDFYDSLDGIGHYVQEFETSNFCASWNKAYCLVDDRGKFKFTIAGIPTSRQKEGIDFNRCADQMAEDGTSFHEIASDLLGYNLTIAPNVTCLNQRIAPVWGDYIYESITDYKGDSHIVTEPCALALFPLAKTVNDTCVSDNAINLEYAKRNNQDVKEDSRILYASGNKYQFMHMRG